MNELEALEQLTRLVETIEANNWEHLYRKVDDNLTFTSLTLRQQSEILRLKYEIEIIKRKTATLQNKISVIKTAINE